METYEEILERMQNKFTQLSGATLNDDSDVGIRMKVLAGEVFSLQNNIEWLKNQMFANTAAGEQLDCLASERGLARKAALPSTGTLTFSREIALDYDVEIPIGTICSTSGVSPVYVKTTQAAVLESGNLSVTVQAKSDGTSTSQNLGINAITVLVTPPPGITSVTNETAFIGAIDAESDDELRERIIDSYKNVSNGTNCAFYKRQALSYDGIYSASVIPKVRGVGTVDIYVAAKGGLPSDALVTQIQNDINNLREINVDVKVYKPLTIALPVVADITVKDGYTFSEVQQECIDNITAYFNTLKIGEPFLVAAVGNAIYTVEGIENYSISVNNTSDRYTDPNQLVILGSITIREA